MRLWPDIGKAITQGIRSGERRYAWQPLARRWVRKPDPYTVGGFTAPYPSLRRRTFGGDHRMAPETTV